MYCWNMWLEYNRICRRIKNAIQHQMESTSSKYFQAWKKFIRDKVTLRAHNVRLMRIRLANANLYNKFFRWMQYTKKNRQLKLHLKRLFAFPHFDVWIQYTKWSKHVKKLNNAATIMQSLVRMYLGRILLIKAQRAQIVLKGFNLLVLCVRTVRKKREIFILKEFEEWKPNELLRRQYRLNDLEKSRINKRSLLTQEKEKNAIKQLKKFLKSIDGQCQLNDMIQDPLIIEAFHQQSSKQQQQHYSSRRGFQTTFHTEFSLKASAKIGFSTLSKREKLNYVETLLLKECSSITKQLEIHNYNTKHVPFICCPDPSCAATFTTEQQYHQHWLTTDRHHRLQQYQELLLRTAGEHQRQKKEEEEALSAPGEHQGQQKDEEVLNTAGEHQGQQKGEEVLNTAGEHQGQQKGEEVLNTAGEHQGQQKGEEVLNTAGEHQGQQKGEEVLNTAGDHQGPSSPGISSFHLFLRHYKGQDLLRHYLIKTNGLTGIVNSLDLWIAIQEWRKTPTTNEQYISKAMNIYELYIIEDAPRPISINTLMEQELREKLQLIKHRNHRGFYERVKAKPSILRAIIGFEGQEYYQWNTSAILIPSIFQDIEYLLFLNLFFYLKNDDKFYFSTAYQEYKKICLDEEIQRENDLKRDYENERLLKIKLWTKDFKTHENAMSLKAGEVVDLIMKRIIDRMVFNGSRYEVYSRSIEKRHEEQLKYEEMDCILEESLFFIEDNLLNDIFDFYTRSMINYMLQLPQCRKGLLQYSGLLKANMTKRLTLAEAAAINNHEDWFDNFFRSTKDLEVSKYNITAAAAVVSFDDEDQTITAVKRIQCYYRGILGRNKARRIFVQVYNKIYDDEYQTYYYYNNHTGESSWYRPYLTDRLFINLNW